MWPVLTLMLLAPLLAEVSSGSMPVTDFVSPQLFFPFTIVVYGLPVLVLREIAVRCGLGLTGLWTLGLIYGLYNEGLFSETLFHPLEHPNPVYAGYGSVANLLLPWLSFILGWHGLFSVVLPVVLVDALFGRHAARPWLPRTPLVVLGFAVTALGLARFVLGGENRLAQTGPMFWTHTLLLVVAAVGLAVVALRLPRTVRVTVGPATPSRLWRGFAAGAALYLLGLLIPDVIVELGAPWPVPVAYSVLAAVAVLWWLRRVGELRRRVAVWFALGVAAAQLAVIPVAVLGVIVGDVERLTTGVVGLAAIAVAMAMTGRGTRRSTVPSRD